MKAKQVKEMTHQQRKEHLESMVAINAALMAQDVANENEFGARMWAKDLAQYARLLRNMNKMHDERSTAVMTFLHL